jgi:two-component system CheB/CheR fusion protein
VVDHARKVRLWNTRAEDLWGLRLEEVRGVDFLRLDIGLPVAQLRDALQACLDLGVESADQKFDAVTRRGRTVRCDVTLTPLPGDDSRGGAIIVMDVADGIGMDVVDGIGMDVVDEEL